MEPKRITWTFSDLKAFAAARCIDIYKCFSEIDVLVQPKSVQDAWNVGRDLVEREGKKTG